MGFRDLKKAKGTKGTALFSHEATEVHQALSLKTLVFKDNGSGV